MLPKAVDGRNQVLVGVGLQDVPAGAGLQHVACEFLRMMHRQHQHFGVRRGFQDLRAGPRFLSKSSAAWGPLIVGASETPLWSDERPGERAYQLGKVQNLRRAAAALNGVAVPSGAVFSFWKQIGRASRRRGFVTGRMLQQGCLVPATGGGLCQLSNALYEAALHLAATFQLPRNREEEPVRGTR